MANQFVTSIISLLIHQVNSSLFSVPVPVCPTPPTSSNGVITVRWSYTHTGGLELIRVIVTAYMGTLANIQLDVPNGNLTDLSQMSLDIATFIAGFQYTFQVTAYNKLGSSTAQCNPVMHLIGMSLSVFPGGAWGRSYVCLWWSVHVVLPLLTTTIFLQVFPKFLRPPMVYQVLLVALLSLSAHLYLVECHLRFFYSLSTSHKHPTAWRVPVH